MVFMQVKTGFVRCSFGEKAGYSVMASTSRLGRFSQSSNLCTPTNNMFYRDGKEVEKTLVFSLEESIENRGFSKSAVARIFVPRQY